MAAIRVGTEGIEVAHVGAANARVGTFAAEVLHGGSANIRVGTFGIEVLRSIADGSNKKRRYVFAMGAA